MSRSGGTLFALVLVASAAAGCRENVYNVFVDEGDVDLTVSETIGQQGGTLRVTDPANPAFGTEVTVPPGAVSRDTEMRVSPASSATGVPAGARPVGGHIDIAFTTLDEPAVVLLPFRLDVGANERLVVLRLPDGGQRPRAVKEAPFGDGAWRVLEATLDEDGRRVRFETEGFGQFVVAAVRAGGGPAADGGTDAGDTDAGAGPLPVGDLRPPEFAGLGQVENDPEDPTVVRLSWKPATDDVTPSAAIRYRIYLPTFGSLGLPQGETAPGTTSLTLPVTPGVRYYFLVRAVDEAGNEDDNLVVRSLRIPGGGSTTDGGPVDMPKVIDGGDRDAPPPVDMPIDFNPPTVVCPQPIFTTPGATETLNATVVPARGDPVVSMQWTLVLSPDGSTAAPASPTSASTDITLDLAGNYELAFTATSQSGRYDSCLVQIAAVAPTGLRIYVSWDTDRTDIDAHLLHGLATVWNDVAYDCYYASCLSTQPEWGVSGPENNPRLDLDDTDGLGPENINLDDPETGVTYRVGAHSYSDPNLTPTTVTARIFCGGALAASYSRVLAQGELWRIADVTFDEAGVCLVSAIDEVVTVGEKPVPR